MSKTFPDERNPDVATHEFRCPACDQVIEVDEPTREAILEHGCPVCSSDVDR